MIKPCFRPAGDRAEDADDLFGVACATFQSLHAESGRRNLDGCHYALQSIRIAKHRDARHIWRNLLECLQPFASDAARNSRNR